MTWAPVVVKFHYPVQWTSDELVSELKIVPTGRAFRDAKLETNAEGGVVYSPYKYACIGVQSAGRPAPEPFVNLMHPADINEVAQVVLGFLAPPPRTGDEPSRS